MGRCIMYTKLGFIQKSKILWEVYHRKTLSTIGTVIVTISPIDKNKKIASFIPLNDMRYSRVYLWEIQDFMTYMEGGIDALRL